MKQNETNLEADVVVIGAGSSGLTAALTASRGGARVIIFEKMRHRGGSSLFAEGMFAVESLMQTRKNIGITRDEVFKRHMANSSWMANPLLIRAFIDKSANTIEWLQQQGVEFTEAAALYPNGPMTWHLIKGGGAALIKALFTKAEDHDVRIHHETPVKKLMVDARQRIVGVIAEHKDGGVIEATAKGVIVAGGGFMSNREMLQQYTSAGPAANSVIETQQTGDPIKMAWEVGAAADGLDALMAVPAVGKEGPASHLWAAGVQPFLWVNQRGERFCDESIIFQFPFAGNALAKQPNQVMYNIFDEHTKNYMAESGIFFPLGVFVPVATKLAKLDTELERGTKEGKAYIANSLADLAEKIGVERGRFLDTTTEYNRHCEKNRDVVFTKDRKYLYPIDKGKFYAVKSSLHIFTTLGGIKINHRTEALNKDYEVIPGLYAIGNCAGGMHGASYDVSTTGGALGFAVNSGRIAGENVLQYVGKCP